MLVLNAGIAGSVLGSGGFQRTRDGFESMVGINYIGHFHLTSLLLPVLRSTPGARVIGMSSVAAANSYACGIDVSSWTERKPDFQDWKQYGQSKLAMVLFMRALQRREASLLCVACHPGVVPTSLLAGPRNLLEFLYQLFLWVLSARVEHAALNTLYLGSTEDPLVPGGFYHPVGRRIDWLHHWFQRLGAFQLPFTMRTSHDSLWGDTVSAIAACTAAPPPTSAS